MKVTADNLTNIMDFEHVIHVHDDGSVTDDDTSSFYAPELYNGKLDSADRMSAGWSLMDGYSGQDRYSGPVMHNSEFIGGGMARDILETPGYYVSIIGYWDATCDTCNGELTYATNEETRICSVCSAEYEGEDPEIEGWAVAYRPS